MKYCSLYKASFTTDVEKEYQKRADSLQSIHFSIGPYKESSAACLKRQKDYYKAFKITNDIRNRGDLTYFVIMFLDILKEEMEYTHGGKEYA